MGFIVQTSATGQGSLSLGGTQTVSEVAAGLVLLADLADLAGFAPHRRLHKQAWYGIGIDNPGGGPFTGIPIITWWTFHQIENETHFFPTTGLILADTLYWDVQPGGEIFIEVDWP